jgi:hypothetical protein
MNNQIIVFYFANNLLEDIHDAVISVCSRLFVYQLVTSTMFDSIALVPTNDPRQRLTAVYYYYYYNVDYCFFLLLLSKHSY